MHAVSSALSLSLCHLEVALLWKHAMADAGMMAGEKGPCICELRVLTCWQSSLPWLQYTPWVKQLSGQPVQEYVVVPQGSYLLQNIAALEP